jgi:hypothetical protein
MIHLMKEVGVKEMMTVATATTGAWMLPRTEKHISELFSRFGTSKAFE